ncbi:hypothetical protein CBOM_03082 [Ceraceosorus bombacis]|uniref:Uncharacterized protein n=1 Tax=Ceraceosorus bombacis TaxID=401625 RepID=A0A0P1BN29_9BASI|nr:hypothetical protein CBOM_03082 [Ceraceosorus bombacis]
MRFSNILILYTAVAAASTSAAPIPTQGKLDQVSMWSSAAHNDASGHPSALFKRHGKAAGKAWHSPIPGSLRQWGYALSALGLGYLFGHLAGHGHPATVPTATQGEKIPHHPVDGAAHKLNGRSE